MSCVLSISASGCFTSFAWAAYGHFRREARLPTGMRWLSSLSLATFAGLIVRLNRIGPETATQAVSLALFLASASLFWWAVRTTRTDRPFVAHSLAISGVLHTTGPYRAIRHPFYSAYIMFWLGAAVAAGPILWPPVCVLCLWYLVIAHREEHRLAESAIQVGYVQYRGRTGMMLPRIRPASPG